MSGREYHGVNILSCLAHQLHHGHQCSAYVTFQQAKSLGGWVRQGERAVGRETSAVMRGHRDKRIAGGTASARQNFGAPSTIGSKCLNQPHNSLRPSATAT